jgi:hypothetical protein
MTVEERLKARDLSSSIKFNLQQNKKKAEAESKNCHAKTMPFFWMFKNKNEMGRTSLPALQARLGRGLTPTVVTWNVVEYRKAADKYVTADDVVLEVGCCGGTTTSVIGVSNTHTYARARARTHTHTHTHKGLKYQFKSLLCLS